MPTAEIKADAEALITWIYDQTKGEPETEVDVSGFFEAGADWSSSHWARVMSYIREQGWGFAVEFSPPALEQDPTVAPVDAFDENTWADPHDPDHQQVMSRGFALTVEGVGHVELKIAEED